MKKYFFELRIVATIVACLAVSVALVGCGKEDNDGSDGPLLTEFINHYYGYSTTYEYDSQNRLTKMTTYYDGKVDRIETLSYNSEGDLISLSREDPDYPNYDGTSTFTKSGNTITMEDAVFELNAQGLLGKITEGSTIYTIQYQDKNMTKMTVEYVGQTVTITQTFDDKKSPFSNCKTPQWYFIWTSYGFYGNLNNPKTAIITDVSGTETATIEYTYNDEGYPITGIQTDTSSWDDEVSVTNVTFVYNTSSTKSALQEAPITSNGINSDIRRDNNRFRHIFGGGSMIRP